jgi:2-oxoisovalerate dehydrogenase E1 component alpha subunit
VTQIPEHWRGTEPLQVLAPDGTPVGDTDVGLDVTALRGILRWMLLARRLDRECTALQRQGELTVYPGFEGQEAAQIGSAMALGPDDFVFPTFRELAAALVRGVDPVQYLAYHRGTWHGGPYDPRATRFGPICIPVATQIVHGVGYAMGLKLDGARACSIAYFGDGSASEGDFHEGANLAGVFTAPVILFCQNNGWAISMPTANQTAGEIWKRADGYGFPGVRVDGNDVLAVYRATKQAAERAYAGDGPTLIEALPRRCRGRGRASVRSDHAVRHVAGRRRHRGRGHDRLVGRGDRGAGAGHPRRRDHPAGAAGRVDVRLDLRRSAGHPGSPAPRGGR